MTNHVHLILVPSAEDSLHKLLKCVHTKYSLQINKRQDWTGHLWQSRFYSSPLDEHYLRTAVRYVELNPVRAGMVQSAELYPWSSAKERLESCTNPIIDYNSSWNKHLPNKNQWRDYLCDDDPEAENLMRRNISQNLPCGSESFLKTLELQSGRQLGYRPRGRPRKR